MSYKDKLDLIKNYLFYISFFKKYCCVFTVLVNTLGK